ncbi:MAG: LLM class flavin-dependent oxidoreductase [Pseudomonadota bacterium]
MKFGLFGGAKASRGGPTSDSHGYRDFIDYVMEAEELGFHSSFLVEHHFTGYGQVSASLSLLSFLAARTSAMRLGTAVVVLPWHNPVLLAEQVATLDLLSNGRVDFGVGKGYRAPEFEGFCIPQDEATERFDEAIEIIRKAWTATGRFSHHGKRWHYENIVVEPAPVQKPYPPFLDGRRQPGVDRAGGARGLQSAARPDRLDRPDDRPRRRLSRRMRARRPALRPDAGRRHPRALYRHDRGGAPEGLRDARPADPHHRRYRARARRRALSQSGELRRHQHRRRGCGAARHARRDHRPAEAARGRRGRERAARRCDRDQAVAAHLRQRDHARLPASRAGQAGRGNRRVAMDDSVAIVLGKGNA